MFKEKCIILSDREIKNITEESFKLIDNNNDGYIDINEYSIWIKRINPLLEYFTINIHGEIAKLSLNQ